MCKECKEIKQEKIRKVFLDDLPIYYKGIDWEKCSELKSEIRFIYDDIEGTIKIVDYKDGFLYIKYEDKEPFKINTSGFKKCALGKLLGKHTNKFKIEIGAHYKDEKRDITITDRKTVSFIRKDNTVENQKWYKYKCNRCGFDCGEHYKDGEFKEEYWILEGGLLSKNKNGCPVCGFNSMIVTKGINSIFDTAPHIIKFFVNQEEANLYSKCSDKKIKVKCPDCGRVRDKKMCIRDIYKGNGINCTCGDGFSYGHKYMHNLISQLNLNFEDNKTFDWCKFYNSFKQKETTGEYDFVLEGLKLIIEVDGGWHRQDNRISGQTKEESKYLDDVKDELAKQYGYKMIRISDEDCIKDNIFNSELINLFNLKLINWNKCEEFALSNRVKEACEYKNNNADMTTGDISKIMGLKYGTIGKYLTKGSKLGWCEYNPEQEMVDNATRTGKSNGKKIEVFKEEISLGIFNSVAELARESEHLFNIKLSASAICRVCNGSYLSYKGYNFIYI